MNYNMIRAAEKGDASRLAEILIFSKRNAYRPIFQDDFVSFNDMQVLELALFYRDETGALNDVYVFDDGIVKGMMSWKRSAADSGVLELKELYTDTFFQGEGVGTALMDYFLAGAQKENRTAVFLWVLEENRRARHFYERFGYAWNGERELIAETTKYVLKYAMPLDQTKSAF